MKKIFLTLTLVFLVFKLFAATNMYAPTLTAPTNGAINQMPDVFLNWDAVPGAWSYKIEVSTDSLFTNPLKYFAYGSAVNASELLFTTTYWWRVKAIGISDSSDWSAFRKFSTIDHVTITAPADSSTGRYVKMLIKWTAITGVANYDWEMDSTLTFNSPIYRTGSALGTATSTFAPMLHFGQKYFLRLRARHAIDTTTWSNPIMVTTLSTFNLRRPNDNYDTLQMPDVTTKWDWAGAPYYNVAFAFDSALTNPVIVTADSSSILQNNSDTSVYTKAPTLIFDTVYYWGVRAFHAFDTSAWMGTRSFRTVKTVTLTKPTLNQTNVNTLPKFEWKAISGITKFMLQYDTSSMFTNPVQKIVGKDTLAFTVTQVLLSQANYYWRMRAVSATDTSAWSAAWNFTTGTTGVENYTLNAENIVIYPNPCHGRLTVEIGDLNNSDVSVTVLDILGQSITKQLMNNSNGKFSTTLNLENLTNGIYLIKIQSGKYAITRKIVLDK
jgi:hypothetical protein